eukprot:8205160-Heterocapsa_arctica.AAC.1
MRGFAAAGRLRVPAAAWMGRAGKARLSKTAGRETVGGGGGGSGGGGTPFPLPAPFPEAQPLAFD